MTQETSPFFRALGSAMGALRQIDSRKLGRRDKHKKACIAASPSSV
jgi:hypothetical protein